ncbi:YgiQ family radical SAM protein [Neobittarella massiliensis]|uniref:YgiQ family radical SAM protein n=1 Tax=Neobittarella massiliensis (ex Bilen et al. 2018) TaxID=2041842 RepID=A0A8J6INZ1_9FIRM|nr:YgiQ family radical SAM protein [Neobittarella massiliensis]MBC3515436.1 YgiQ family radical SAM protein [Neobittarella massiliensis]
MRDFLPICRADMEARGWEQVDFVYISGDSYIDHPSFGAAIITRLLEDRGYRVAILPQPDIGDEAVFTQFGTPRLGFMISSGNVDSMVNHYTVAKKRRSTDFYTAGGEMGRRPDRAVTVYTRTVRRLYPQSAIIIGGVEASLRRFAHYDYWDDKVRPSILADSGADLISYGMGEYQTIELADRLAAGEPISAITDVRGTCYMTTRDQLAPGFVECASFEKVRENKLSYAKATAIQYGEFDYARGRTVVQKHGDRVLVQNPPAKPLDTEMLDYVYALPYQRTYHPSYEKLGGVPAIKEVEFSIIHNRGCFGACNFCAIAVHQGRHITCRSTQSVLKEAKALTENPRFKGYIHDVGGPTANFRQPSCSGQLERGMCKNKKCLAPTPCPRLQVDHREYDELLSDMRKIPGIKKVFVRSGIRFDYLNLDKDQSFFDHLVAHHVSGQLKVAPEHCSAGVLAAMGKPAIAAYKRFQSQFYKKTAKIGKKQYLVPYLMSSHPGSGLKEAIDLALFLKEEGLHPQQVQDFYPTPNTVSTCMYYTGLDPFTLQPVYVATDPHEKAMQRALIQYFLPQNRALVCEALLRAGRADLIGVGKNCLVRPDQKTAAILQARREKVQQRPQKGRDRRPGGKKGSPAGRGKRPATGKGADRWQAQNGSRKSGGGQRKGGR